MSKTFDQTILGKSAKGYSLSAAGCGCCALASIVSNKDATIIPYKVATYLESIGAFSNAGTTRSGITKALDHYGFQSLYYTPEHTGNAEWSDAMELIKATANANVWAILLVVGTVNGGHDNFWTSGGHYIAVTSYKKENGIDKVYVRDSGAKKHTGWYSISSLKFDTNAMWVIGKK